MNKFRKIVGLAMAMLFVLTVFAPIASAESVYCYGTIANGGANATKSTSSSSTVLASYIGGDQVAIYSLNSAGTHYRVQTDEGVGYLPVSAVSGLSKTPGGAASAPATGTPATGSTVTVSTITASGDAGYIDNCSSSVNYRSQPKSGSSYKLGTIKKGTPVTITGESGSYYQCLYNGKTVYIAKDYVTKAATTGTTVTPGQGSAAASGQAAYIANCSSSVNYRSQPKSGSSYKLGSIKKGTAVTVTGESGSYYQCLYNGKTVYISKQYVALGTASGGTTVTVTPSQGSTTTPSQSTTTTQTAAPSAGRGYTPAQGDQIGSYWTLDKIINSGTNSTIASRIQKAYGKNSDVIGYINIPNTNIDSAIVYRKSAGTFDSSYYYNTHDPDGRSRSTSYSWFPVYGYKTHNIPVLSHNMRTSGTVYHEIHHLQEADMGYSTCRYSKCSDSIKKHQGWTSGNGRYWNISLYGYNTWEVFAMYETAGSEPKSTLQTNIASLENQTDAAIRSWIDYQIARSQAEGHNFGVNPSTGDQFITLVGCGTEYDSDPNSQARLYVFLRAVG